MKETLCLLCFTEKITCKYILVRIVYYEKEYGLSNQNRGNSKKFVMFLHREKKFSKK